MNTKQLVKLRKAAEKAVADMPDGDLKVKAFEVILAHTMEEPETPTAAKAAPRAAVKSSSAARNVKTTTGRILLLRDEDFFRTQKSIVEICDELASHGWHYPQTGLSGPLQSLVQRGELRRMRVKRGNKKLWVYSER